MTRAIGVVFALSVGTIAIPIEGCDSAPRSATMFETCVAGDRCDDGLSCECGVCTTPCSSNAECGDGACEPIQLGCGGTGELCVRRCAVAEDCNDAQRCASGQCVGLDATGMDAGRDDGGPDASQADSAPGLDGAVPIDSPDGGVVADSDAEADTSIDSGSYVRFDRCLPVERVPASGSCNMERSEPTELFVGWRDFQATFAGARDDYVSPGHDDGLPDLYYHIRARYDPGSFSHQLVFDAYDDSSRGVRVPVSFVVLQGCDGAEVWRANHTDDSVTWEMPNETADYVLVIESSSAEAWIEAVELKVMTAPCGLHEDYLCWCDVFG